MILQHGKESPRIFQPYFPPFSGLEPRLSQAPDLGALCPWRANRHLRGVSVKEGDENQHPLTSWVKCIGYHPCQAPGFLGDEGGSQPMRSSPPISLSCPSRGGFQMVRTSLPGPSEEAKGLSASFLLGVCGEGLASPPGRRDWLQDHSGGTQLPLGSQNLGAGDRASPGERTQSLRGLCIFMLLKRISSPISGGTRAPLLPDRWWFQGVGSTLCVCPEHLVNTKRSQDTQRCRPDHQSLLVTD